MTRAAMEEGVRVGPSESASSNFGGDFPAAVETKELQTINVAINSLWSRLGWINSSADLTCHLSARGQGQLTQLSSSNNLLPPSFSHLPARAEASSRQSLRSSLSMAGQGQLSGLEPGHVNHHCDVMWHQYVTLARTGDCVYCTFLLCFAYLTPPPQPHCHCLPLAAACTP